MHEAHEPEEAAVDADARQPPDGAAGRSRRPPPAAGRSRGTPPGDPVAASPVNERHRRFRGPGRAYLRRMSRKASAASVPIRAPSVARRSRMRRSISAASRIWLECAASAASFRST
jgi:hypothetical protein